MWWCDHTSVCFLLSQLLHTADFVVSRKDEILGVLKAFLSLQSQTPDKHQKQFYSSSALLYALERYNFRLSTKPKQSSNDFRLRFHFNTFHLTSFQTINTLLLLFPFSMISIETLQRKSSTRVWLLSVVNNKFNSRSSFLGIQSALTLDRLSTLFPNRF